MTEHAPQNFTDRNDSEKNLGDDHVTIEDELRFLSNLHRMNERSGVETQSKSTGTNSTKIGRKRTLKPFHMEDFKDEDFQGDRESKQFRRFQIFNRYARSVCKIKAIPRKEVFEAWSMALHVHDYFLSSSRKRSLRRFADLACSHGLLSWAIMLLSSSEDEETALFSQNNQLHLPPLTGVCIDISMPKSSETAAGIFFEDYPQFCDDGSFQTEKEPDSRTASASRSPRWEYVEGPVENIVPDASTLLVGIHACGRLSDTIIDLAIQSNAPLALVPCCHSKKILTTAQATEFASIVASSSSSSSRDSPSRPIPSYSLADFMDAYRTQRLVDAGYTVREVQIPQEFTPKNRIILASPPLVTNTTQTPLVPKRQTFHKESLRKEWGIKRFDIPIADTPTARAVVQSISGREAANQRKDAAYPPPAICVSVWLPEEKHADEKAQGFSVEALQKVMDREIKGDTNDGILRSKVRVENATHNPFYRNSDGRLSKTLRIHYLDCKNDKAKAKACHKFLREVTIPHHFPDVVLRH